jgi:hypothetical protein
MQSDDDLNAVLRAASQIPVDEARLTRAVLTRIRDDDASLFGLFGNHKRGVGIAFASVLAATPIAVMQIPPSPEDAMFASLLLGQDILDGSALDILLTDEGLE